MTSIRIATGKAITFKLPWFDRLLALLLWLLALLFIACFVHIISIFALPELAQKDAFSRLSAMAQPGHLFLLPPPVPGHEFAPFEDPAAVQAACLYNLDRGPLEFSADLVSDGLLSFSFRTATGRVFYSMTDKAASHGKLDALILTAKQLEDVEADDDEDELPQELRLVAPQNKGFVLINALVPYPSARAEIESLVKSMTCEIDEQPAK